MENEVVVESPEVPAEITAEESRSAVQSAYDRIAHPDKVQDEPPVAPTAPVAAVVQEPEFSQEQLRELASKVARIPELEKQLRDAGGRYGALKQSLTDLQQRLTAAPGNATADVEDMLQGVKEEFGEEGLYTSLKTAFSKVVAGRSIDPGMVEKLVADKIAAVKQAETDAAIEQLSELHPTWQEDRASDAFKDWLNSLPARERTKLERSQDPAFVADRLDAFQEWKTKKATPQPPPAEAPKPKAEHPPSKRLTNAVLPTHGTKPKPAGEDSKAEVMAAYLRAAGKRL